jgi:hypothetical protein
MEYHYVVLIPEIKDAEVRELVESIRSDCPEKILGGKEKEIDHQVEIFRFVRKPVDKYPFFFKPKVFKMIAEKGELKTCQMCGLSVSLNLEALKRKVKEKYKKAKLVFVKATFNTESGKLYRTPSVDDNTHCTFFPCESFNHDEFFKEINEG